MYICVRAGIDKNSSEAAIRKAYHKEAVKLHPDKPGGDTKKFQKLQDLYQEGLKINFILSSSFISNIFICIYI